MNHTTAVTLVALAVAGAIGGTVTAAVRGDAPSTPAAAGSPSASPTAEEPGVVLYAGAGVIHDGDRTVKYRAPFATPDRLVRSSRGWLISKDTDSEVHPHAARLYSVAPDGSTTEVAEVADAWDVNEQGDRVVGADVETGAVKVWDLDGDVVATWPGPQGVVRPVWSGDLVLASAVVPEDGDPGGESGLWSMFRWNVATGDSRQLDVVGLPELSASRDGGLLAGSVGTEGVPVIEQNYCLAVMNTPGRADPDHWDTCDWRLNGGRSGDFSPNGTRILAVPSETDGFGPGLFATFSASAGPSEGLQKFQAPDWTMDATWLDEEHLLVMGATDGNLDDKSGSWLQRCDLRGECEEVARSEHGLLVPGEQG